MQRSKSVNSFFENKPSHLSKKNINLTVIIDPDILFFTENGKYYINPIIKNWLIEVQKNRLINYKVYLLSTQDSLHLDIDIGDELFRLKIESIFFKHPIGEHTKDDICQLWIDKKIKVIAQNSTDGFTNDINPAETMLITANPNLATLFKENKKIAVALMSHTTELISSTCFDEFTLKDDIEVYCDFDGTLFDHHKLSLLATLQQAYADPHKRSVFDIILDEQSNLTLLQNQTISLLKKLHHYPMYLITQRSYDRDQAQPRYNCAYQVVDHINAENNLFIQHNQSSYLNSHAQIAKTDTYLKKIEVIYDRIISRDEHLRPKHIILFDDDNREILKCEYYKPLFANFGIQVHSVFVTIPSFQEEAHINKFKIASPQLFKKIQSHRDQQINQLNNALEGVKRNQSLPKHQNIPFAENSYRLKQYS